MDFSCLHLSKFPHRFALFRSICAIFRMTTLARVDSLRYFHDRYPQLDEILLSAQIAGDRCKSRGKGDMKIIRRRCAISVPCMSPRIATENGLACVSGQKLQYGSRFDSLFCQEKSDRPYCPHRVASIEKGKIGKKVLCSVPIYVTFKASVLYKSKANLQKYCIILF